MDQVSDATLILMSRILGDANLDRTAINAALERNQNDTLLNARLDNLANQNIQQNLLNRLDSDFMNLSSKQEAIQTQLAQCCCDQKVAAAELNAKVDALGVEVRTQSDLLYNRIADKIDANKIKDLETELLLLKINNNE